MSVDKRGTCRRCKKTHQDLVARLTNNDPKVYVDYKRAVYACEIPHYTTDEYGNPFVTMYNCETKLFVDMSQAIFEAKRRKGEV